MIVPALEVEILSGPLDGEKLTLKGPTEWTREGDGPLSFPWDLALGAPQARLIPGPEGWTLEPLEEAQVISCINRDIKVSAPIRLRPGDVLRASTSWLMIVGNGS